MPPAQQTTTKKPSFLNTPPDELEKKLKVPNMVLKFLTRLFLVIFLVVLVFASISIKENFLDKSALITVSGEGKVEAQPKLVKLKISFSNTATSSASAISGNEDLAKVLVQLLGAQGVSKGDIKLFNVSLTPVQNSAGGLTFRASNDAEVVLRDTSKYQALINSLFDGEFSAISDVSFNTDNAKALEKQAVDGAIKYANENAKSLAKSAGKRLGKMISLTTNESGDGGRSIGQAKEDNVSVPERIEIVRNATIVYELK